METTPSLACANKCVFCWRHHSNPVGTEWKWKMDPAETVLEGALENHYKMIKQMKGETLDRPAWQSKCSGLTFVNSSRNLKT